VSDSVKLPNVDNTYEWLKSLSQYKQQLLDELLDNFTPEEAARIWLDASIKIILPSELIIIKVITFKMYPKK